jgi:hypothetical protein
MTLLIKWVLAHLIGDFLLQTRSLIDEKENMKWRSPRLLGHVTIHFLLIFIVTWDLNLWHAALIIAVSHWIIDSVKLQLQTTKTKTIWFFTDQALHLLVIILVWSWLYEPEIAALFPWQPEYWLILTAAVFLTIPASSVIQHLMLRWSDSIEETQSDSLKDAGKYIGILERLFIFISILIGYWQTVGFLIAAKSVFRFGDLTKAKDRKLTEYILIGTLLSFGIALTAAILVA